MLKKMMLLALSVAALAAFAVPATASAAAFGEITDEAGLVEGEIFATSTNTETVTDNGTLYCEHVKISGHVTKNDSTGSEATGTAVTKNCYITQNPAVKVHITNGALKNLTLDAATNTGSAELTYNAEITGAVTIKCHYSGKVGVIRTGGTDIIHVSGNISGTPAPPCDSSAQFSGTFNVSSNNGPVIIH